MKINERVSDDRLSTLANLQSHECMALPAGHNEVAMMARELQQYRAAAEPVVYIGKQMLESLCDEGGRICGRVWRSNTDELSGESRIPLYAAPQVTSVAEELLSAMEDVLRISDRDHDAWNRAKYAIAAIRSAPAVQAEQEPHKSAGAAKKCRWSRNM